MAWVRIDDRFAKHPKVVAAGPLAMAMQVAALGYCNSELTDGYVPRSVARTLIDCDPECGINVDATWVINRLVEYGIWVVVEGGYRIHDFLDYQPSKDEVLSLRETRADAGRRGGQKRADNLKEANEAKAKQNASNLPSKNEANAKQTSNPVPVSRSRNPLPEPGESPPTPPPRRGEYPQDFLDFLGAYGETDGAMKPAYTAWKRLSAENKRLALAGLPKWQASRKWLDGFKPYPQRYLTDKVWEKEPSRASPNGRPPMQMDELAAMDARLSTPEPDYIDATFRSNHR